MIIDADEAIDGASNKVKPYMQANGYDMFICYCHDVSAYQVGSTLWSPTVAQGGYGYRMSSEGGYPASIFFDRDGNARKFGYGAIDGNPDPYEDVIKQLTGAI